MISQDRIISSEDLRWRTLQMLFPNLSALNQVVENTDWHNEDVLTHTRKVIIELENVIPSWPILEKQIGRYTRANLLLIAGAFHDVGKKQTLHYENGKTSCPGHEELGARMAESDLDILGLSSGEESGVLNLIRHHGEIHKITKPINPDWIRQYQELSFKCPILELTFLGYADTKASRLAETRQSDYQMRIARYEEIFNELKGGEEK
ncbi:MAG: HD domain-containing protein [Nanoarchaeota archaeon]